MVGVLGYRRCFPEEDGETAVLIYHTCQVAFNRGRVSNTYIGSTILIGCKHKYPKELRDLTLLKEKLIFLNTAYRFITKFNL
jgi:hypothetical protein